MTINFEHLMSWEALYNDCRLAENNTAKDGRAEHILAMKSMGSALEKMVGLLTEHYGITDAMVLESKSRRGQQGSVDLLGKIEALEDRNVLDRQSSDHYNRLRKFRNNAVHDNYYETKSDGVIASDMEQMYSLLYQESWILANEYMKRPGGGSSYPKVDNGSGYNIPGGSSAYPQAGVGPVFNAPNAYPQAGSGPVFNAPNAYPQAGSGPVYNTPYASNGYNTPGAYPPPYYVPEQKESGSAAQSIIAAFCILWVIGAVIGFFMMF